MNIYGKTDVGKSRKINQDAFAYGKPSEKSGFAFVCDGMGGQNGGNIASQTMRDILLSQLFKALSKPSTIDSVSKALANAYIDSNKRIFDKASSEKNLKDMGTTVVSAILIENDLLIGNVGDSRAYLYTNGMLTQLTVDHSYVQILVDSGELTQEEARFHPRRNEITRAIGIDANVEYDFVCSKVRCGDRVLLCSDGLTSMCSNEEIRQILQAKKDLKQSVSRLITLANSNGGCDNITVILMEV